MNGRSLSGFATMAGRRRMRSHYDFKASPYSSHSLLLAAFGRAGAGRRVLDLGCGNAYLGAILAEQGFEVVGVERAGWYDPPGPPGVRIVEGDLEQGIPEVGAGYDFVMCADILEHLRDPHRLLERALPLLKPSGRVIASLPNSGNLYFRLNILFGRFPQEEKGLFDRTHVRFFMWDGWQSLFARSGFTIETVHPSGIPVGLAFPALDGTLPVRWAEWFCYHAARVWKTLFAYQFIVVAKPVRG